MTEPKRSGGDELLPVSPSQTIGPFFHDVVVLTGASGVSGADAAGERVRIEGRVLDGAGDPVDDALVEVWQPELASADGGNGEGFARSETADAGRFTLTVIKPDIPADGPAPFVLVRLFARGLLRSLVTRIYFEDHLDDPVLDSVDASRRGTLIAERDEATDPPTYRFDIHLQGEHETVFFELRNDAR
jgi:protocatechuate 3,4-dioxygenase alpha subunit